MLRYIKTCLSFNMKWKHDLYFVCLITTFCATNANFGATHTQFTMQYVYRLIFVIVIGNDTGCD